MDLFDALKNRYSHKEGFLPDPVPLDDLEKIAQAGLDAPNGGNLQTVRLIILPDKASVAPVCAVVPTIGLETAPAAIAVLTDSVLAQTAPVEGTFEKEDYSAAVTQMLLAAAGLGYASLWLDSPYFDPARQKEAVAALGAPDSYHLWAVLPVGKPDGTGSRRTKMEFNERVSYIRFGGKK